MRTQSLFLAKLIALAFFLLAMPFSHVYGLSTSADGRYMPFVSFANYIVANDTNGLADVFVHDMLTGSTTRVSVATDGTEGNGNAFCTSASPSISADGRYVVFCSRASNLVPNDTNGVSDVFVHDMVTGSTTRVSVATDGTEGNETSSTPPQSSLAISDDGRYVLFNSAASNLVPGDTHHDFHTYVHDMVTGSTTMASVASDGTEENTGSGRATISGNGRYVAFQSTASNLDPSGKPGVFVHDMVTGSTTLAGPFGQNNSISADGRYVLFSSNVSDLVPNDTNGTYDYFVYDMVTGSTTRVSVASDGTQGNGSSLRSGSISPDGRYVTFQSFATNLDPSGAQGVFVHDMLTGATALVNGAVGQTSISADDRYIAYLPNDAFFLTLNPLFPTNQAPALSPIGNKTVNEGQNLSFTLSATDPDSGDTLTYSASNLPPGATFDSATRTFSWTPDYTQAGNYPNVEFTVMDNGSPMMLDFEDITITVGNVNRSPVLSNPGPQQVLEHNSLTFNVSATDPDGNAVTLSASGMPSGATFDPATGIFSWTPGYPTAGVYAPTFIATDNGTPVATSSIDVVITVGSNPTPTEQAQTTVDTVVAASLPTNTENSYLANLNKVGTFIQNGNVQAAINQLNAFIQKVNQDYSHGTITLAEKNEFIALAQSLINALS